MRRLALLSLPIVSLAAALHAPSSATLSMTAAPGDSIVKFRATWNAACDVRGCATAYLVRWRSTNPLMYYDHTSTVTNDTVTFRLPNIPDSTRVSATLFSIRRGLTSTDSTVVVRWFKRDEAPPPAPTSAAVDTATTS